MITEIRKAVGKAVFNNLVHPPEQENSSLVFHGGDYGHGYLYEEIFCRSNEDLEGARALIADPNSAVLDLAGGAGRFSLLLAKEGRRVSLVDKSVTMLEIARRRKKELPAKLHGNLKIFPQDISQLQLGQEFGTIFSINNGLEHLKSEALIASALLKAKNHLSAQGHFYIDVHYPPYWEKTSSWKSSKWEYSQDFKLREKRYRVWARTRGDKNPLRVTWEHAITQNLFHYTFLRTELLMLPLQRWHQLFSECGFKVVDIWGDWSGKKLDVTRPKMIFNVKKA